MNVRWKYHRWRHARIQALEAYVLTAQFAVDEAYIAEAEVMRNVLPEVQAELARLTQEVASTSTRGGARAMKRVLTVEVWGPYCSLLRNRVNTHYPWVTYPSRDER